MAQSVIGISGFAGYIPSYRVPLNAWCEWNRDQWDKVRNVIGTGFRMRGANENAYTMAATAVLRLIRQFDIDPARIGFLGLGTESSTDNSAGAVIVKGMVNDGLESLGLPAIRRACEVPEFKHACLGGVYAMKAAARYLALDGRGSAAIVVCSDVAEYERNTSGEPTQGAGAVAFLLEENPTMLALELERSGSASAYRGPDFRKPFYRFMTQTPGELGQPRDFPVFNGRYSTTCYVDEVLAAVTDMFARIDDHPSEFIRSMYATFLHRPYQRMAETGLAMAYLYALAIGDAKDRAELNQYASAAGVDIDALIAELKSEPDVYALVKSEHISDDLYACANAVARHFRETTTFKSLMTPLGLAQMSEIGNLYTASLPAWMAAGFEQAAEQPEDLTGRRVLTIGYGSGNAAEVIPMRIQPGWREASRRIAFNAALANPVDLDEAAYHALHDGDDSALADMPATKVRTPGVFYIDRIGRREHHLDDTGIEYYSLQPED